MKETEQVYIRLQRHLDRQPVGFPATRSGSEIRILKHIFTPREAQIAACLTYRPEPLEKIYARAGDAVETAEELEELLGSIESKGGIEARVKDGKKHYCNAPLVVGMLEFQLGRLTTDFIRDFNEYSSHIKFGIDFLSTALPQMRTIPIAESIEPRHHVSTFDEATRLLKGAEPPLAIFECLCRKKKAIEGLRCGVTDRKETCLAVGHWAEAGLKYGLGRALTMDEALAILERNQKEGLVLQPSNTEMAEFICSCCGCCCGMLRMQRRLPKPVELWASNFFAVVDAEACKGCGACEKRCQVKAVRRTAECRKRIVDRDRCIGCGICIPVCPAKAISLHKKAIEVRPPKTREDLYEAIMSRKKGGPAKLRLVVKLIVDALQTGRMGLLKP